MSGGVFKSWTRSLNDQVKVIQVWTIEKFSLRKEEILCSSKFSSNMAPDSYSGKWYMNLHPNGNGKASRNNISLYLCKDNESSPYIIHLSFTMHDDEGNVLFGREMSNPTFAPCPKSKLLTCGFPKFCKRSEILDKLPNDVLKITCELSHHLVENSSGDFETSPSRSCDHFDSFGAFLTDDCTFSDVTLCVGKERTEFKAHRAILSVRCPYFGAMLAHEFREGMENRVEIEDVKPDVFKKILDYIYTQNEPKKLHSSESVAKDILVAADRFSLDRLKTLAEDALASKLDIENVTDFFVLAHTYSANDLKDAATAFLTDNLEEILETPNGARDIVVAAHDCIDLNQPRFKKLAENFLVSKLCVENASQLIILGDTHSAGTLKIAATDFVAENLKEVMKTQGWREILTQHPHLMNEPILKRLS